MASPAPHLRCCPAWRSERMAAVTSASQQVDDQLTFNQMVGGVTDPKATNLPRGTRRDHIYPVRAARTDGKVMLAGPTGAWKVAPLSARAVCTAHRYHIQQAMDPAECLILHLTFVEGWPKNPGAPIALHPSTSALRERAVAPSRHRAELTLRWSSRSLSRSKILALT